MSFETMARMTEERRPVALLDGTPIWCDRPVDTAMWPGPHVIDGRLVYVMIDGSKILCECIRDPYASQIVSDYAAIVRGRDQQ